MSDKVLFKVVYNKEKKVFELSFGTENRVMSPVQFARLVEYIELVYKSFCNSQKKGEV